MTQPQGPYGAAPYGHAPYGPVPRAPFPYGSRFPPRRRHPVDIAASITLLALHTLLLAVPVVVVAAGTTMLTQCTRATVCGPRTLGNLALVCATGAVGVLWLASVGLTMFCIVTRRPGWWAALLGVIGHGGLTLVTYLLIVAAGPVG